jgi:hypothetical protein
MSRVGLKRLYGPVHHPSLSVAQPNTKVAVIAKSILTPSPPRPSKARVMLFTTKNHKTMPERRRL